MVGSYLIRFSRCSSDLNFCTFTDIGTKQKDRSGVPSLRRIGSLVVHGLL